MERVSADKIVERLKNKDNVIIVGAGERGKELLTYLKNNSIIVKEFFDNNSNLERIEGVKVSRPYKIENGKCIYIIAIVETNVILQEKLFSQLQSLGIEAEDIILYDRYTYLSGLKESEYYHVLQEMYYRIFGKYINWDNPLTYNEKINCEKLNIANGIQKELVNKLLVRDWIKQKIGEKYLTKLYGVWEDADEINFEDLPNAFVLKMNNASNRNIIVKDKSQIDQDIVRRQLKIWKQFNFAYDVYELQYRDIVPMIMCEEYLDGVAESVYDYNIYCFHGQPEYIWCIKGSHRPECKATFYNRNWEMMPFSYGYPKDNELAPRPNNLEQMLEISRILSKDFKHVRVDLYNLPNGDIFFGEMTFTTWGGLKRFVPDEWDTVFGKLI